MNRDDLSLLAKSVGKLVRGRVEPLEAKIRTLEEKLTGVANADRMAEQAFRIEALEREVQSLKAEKAGLKPEGSPLRPSLEARLAAPRMIPMMPTAPLRYRALDEPS